MRLRPLRHRRAKTDVLRIFVEIGEHNFDAAQRFLRAVNDDIQRLAEMPGIGAPTNFRARKLKGLRSWPVKGFRKYLIFYRIADPKLHILRVIHGARNLEQVLRE